MHSIRSPFDLSFVRIPLLPFWIGTGVFTAMFLYAVFILPEALTSERREELMQANTDLQDYGDSSSGVSSPSGNRPGSPIEPQSRLLLFLKRINFLKKLSIFLPRRDEETNRRDYRLLLLAIAFTIYRIGSMYMNDVSMF